MRARGLLAVAVGSALVAAALQACGLVGPGGPIGCGDCNCPPPGGLVVDSADDPDLIGAKVQDIGSQVIIRYVKDGVHWTVTYDLTSGDTGE